MHKFYALLMGLFVALSAQAQVAGLFDIHIMKWRFNATTEAYMDANGYSTDARILGHSAIYGSGDASKANLESVRNWLIKSFPDVNSSNYVIINWETGPYVAMRKYPVTDSRFKAAESEIIRLIDEVKRVRPHIKVSMYQMPFRFWYTGQNDSYNAEGKFDKIFAKIDFIAPSYYMLYADEEVGHERNLQYIRENLNVALTYGKKFNKPVIPFMWHKIHPNVSDKYAGEIMQKEAFAKYIKYIYSYSYNNYKAAGVWWYDGLNDQLKDVSGINNFLQGSVYDKATYNTMIVNHARHVKEVLNGATATSPAPTNPTPAPTTQKVVSYTLIDATTEKPVLTIANGGTLNLATLPTKKLNIRANTNPVTVGSVVFSLSGTQSRKSTETAAPYALFGDSGGNYNAWTPATGSYTLKATPYTAASGRGTAGTPLTISFTVINKITATSTTKATMAGSESIAASQEADSVSSESSVYPNPATTQLNIRVAGAGAGLCTIRIFDWSGKVMQTKTVDNDTFNLATELDVADLPRGLYILRTETPQGIHTSQRIILE